MNFEQPQIDLPEEDPGEMIIERTGNPLPREKKEPTDEKKLSKELLNLKKEIEEVRENITTWRDREILEHLEDKYARMLEQEEEEIKEQEWRMKEKELN